MIELIKKKMIELGRDDFVNYLAYLLGISRQTASKKLSGQSKFTVEDLTILTRKLGFTADDLNNIVGADFNDG